MKLSISFLLLFIIADFAHAGLPDEDFTVDLTRESFRDGSLPSTQDLHLDYQWACGSYSTHAGTKSGTTGITLNQVFFTRKNGIINRTTYFPGKLPLQISRDQLESEAISEINPGAELFHYAIRKNHGGLLIEMAVPTQDSSPEVTSIAFPGMRAIGYLYCLPYDVKSGAKKVMNNQWGDLYSK